MEIPARLQESLEQEHIKSLRSLEASLKNIPEIFGGRREKSYVPSNPCATPEYFPSSPAPIFDDHRAYERFDTDTLFFIFYFQQGTQQQYWAARQLKRQSWRYHTKYLTWFQRHDDPKVTTDEYEQGTYVYFDHDASWCQRIKTDFRFEYVYLEDELPA
jgi:CCR4-NOT transcription complex subunit 3